MAMIEFKLDGIEEAKKMVSSRLMREVLEKALNETVLDVKKAEVEEMRRIFDRPTPWILNSLYVWRANRTNLEASLRIKDGAVKILAPHIYGGSRQQKRSEKWLRAPYWIPGQGARFNKYGNISPGQITQILSATGAHPDPYARTTARSRKRNKAMPNYFVARHSPHLQPGIYQRMAGGKIKPVLIFVKNVNYPIRFDFLGVAEKTAAKVINRNFKAVYEAVLRVRI
jgi:hypothetical protein